MTAEFHGEEEILGKAYDAHLMARILRYLRPYWKLLTVTFTFLLLHTGTQLSGPYITKIAIDRYILNHDIHGLDLMALAYLGAVLLGFLFLFIQTYTTEYTGQRAMHDLRMEIFSHLQTQDMAYFDRNPVGRLMTRTVNNVETLNELFSTGVVGLLGDCSLSSALQRSCSGWTGNWRSSVSRHFRRFFISADFIAAARARSIGKAG